MRLRFFQMSIQLLIITSFFFKIFNYHLGNEKIPITGFEALIKNEYFIVGNIFMAMILLVSAYHLGTQIIALTHSKLYEKLELSLTIAINSQLLFGLLVVTFLGTYLEFLGMLMIGLIVIGVFLKHKYNI